MARTMESLPLEPVDTASPTSDNHTHENAHSKDKQWDTLDSELLIVEMNNIVYEQNTECSLQNENDNEDTIEIKHSKTLNKENIPQTHHPTDTVIVQENGTHFYLSVNIDTESLTFNIDICTPYNQWSINKSFKDFQLLHSKLHSDNNFRNTNIPKLPPLLQTTIQSYLLYLTLLLNKTVFLQCETVLQFIEAPQNTVIAIEAFEEERVPVNCERVKVNNKNMELVLHKHTLQCYGGDTMDNGQINLLQTVKESHLEIFKSTKNSSFCLKTPEIQWNIECNNEYDRNKWIESIQKMVSLIKYCRDHKITQQKDRIKQLEKPVRNKACTDYRIDYEVFQWIFVVLFTLWAVIDRYTVNLWPLWVDSPGPTIPGNFGVSVFTVISWVSSRMLLVSSSYVFLSQCHVFFNWVAENKCINKYIKIGDIRQSNARLHYHIGWAFVGVPVVLHVWSILFAASFAQNSVKLYQSWMRPSDANGLNIPFYANNLLSLGMNDIYRLVSTSVTFFILIPYSVIKKCRDKNWSFAQWIHLIGSTIYTVDLLRMYSHPHCWVFNIPFILMWICDRLYGIWCYRRCTANVVQKTQLGDQYTILYLRIDDYLHSLHTIGDVFYFNRLDCGGGDRAHPFTVFQNHGNAHKMAFTDECELDPKWTGHKFSIRDRANQPAMRRMTTLLNFSKVSKDFDLFGNDLECGDYCASNLDTESIPESPNDWNVGVIVQVMPDHEHSCYERKTWTNDLQQIDFRYLCGLRAWGPYRSEYRILLKAEDQSVYPRTPLVLIASGAGCAYLIDYYQYIVANDIKLERMVHFYFTTRSLAMFQWFTDLTCAKHIDNFDVNAHLTSHNEIKYDPLESNSNGAKTRNSAIGRMSFQEILQKTDKSTQVFFCGSPTIQQMAKTHCKKLGLEYHAGHSFHA